MTRRTVVPLVFALAAGCRDGRAGDDAGPDAGRGNPSGAVVLVGNDFGDGRDDLLFGYFGDFTATGVPPACPGTDAGYCCLVPLGIGLPLVSPLLFPEDTQFQYAGLLTVTDTTTGVDLGTATPGRSGSNPMYVAAGLTAWADQDTLSVVAGGGVFPAFDWSVQSPATWTGLDPSIASGAAGKLVLQIPVTSDFTVTWTPQPDLNDAIIGVTGTEGAENLIRCYGLESDGHLIFPADLLAAQGMGAG